MSHFSEQFMGGIVQRQRELRRRRHRRQKLKVFKRKLAKANASEKTVLAGKIRALTPGAETIIANWGLESK
jgi:hypothetical protein